MGTPAARTGVPASAGTAPVRIAVGPSVRRSSRSARHPVVSGTVRPAAVTRPVVRSAASGTVRPVAGSGVPVSVAPVRIGVARSVRPWIRWVGRWVAVGRVRSAAVVRQVVRSGASGPVRPAVTRPVALTGVPASGGAAPV